MLTIRRQLSSRKRRGTVLLEFVMIFPAFLFLILFAVDMGRVILISGTLTDSAYVAARSGAQRGSATLDGNAERAFNRALDAMPGSATTQNVSFTIVAGECNASNSYIVIEAETDVQFITPGLDRLLAIGGGEGIGSEDGLTLTSRGSVLCEIRRS